ncbi:CHAT domain-containing protein [Mycena vulgaris]|nr:CHAT domain-containing protein [Mycena vulgaris]
MGQEAVTLAVDGDPDKPSIFNAYSTSLFTRFQRLGTIDDLNKAVSIQEGALRLTPQDHPDKPTRFKRLGHTDDLAKCVAMQEDAVSRTPDDHPGNPRFHMLAEEAVGRSPEVTHRAATLDSLGITLVTRFKHSGNPNDLSKAYLCCSCCDLTSKDHSSRHVSDINKCVAVLEETIHLTPDGHVGKPGRMGNLGNALRTRFQQFGDLSDLNKSVLIQRDAVRLTPESDPGGIISKNLANALHTRFERLGAVDDLNQSISTCESVVRLTPDGHPDRASRLNLLGNSLLTRSEKTGDLKDLDRSISFCGDACQITPDSHPNKPTWLINMSNGLSCRFRRLNNLSDINTCVSVRENAPFTISLRFQRLHDPRDLDRMILHYSAAAQAYKVALELLPELAWLGLSIRTLARDAAGAAIASGQPEKAVEWLEQGRSIIWGQLLELQSHPTLADQLILLSTKLELGRFVGKSHAYAEERNKLLKYIRKLQGFQRFLLPKTMHELTEAAPKGPVIVLNITDSRCDALILMPGLGDEVIHVPLANFTSRDVQTLAESLGSILHEKGRSDRLVGRREGYVPPEDVFSHILSELWVRVAKPILIALAITFFGSKLSDFVVSSYTPSLTALIQGFRPQSNDQPELQLLAVAQPSATGQLYIPGTRKEINNLEQLAKSRKIPVMRLDENMATVESVQQGMKDSRWVHFASHGVQDRSEPTQSALLLAKSSRLTLAKIIQLSLPYADLAFLSACQTATGDKSLQEESVHLAAGMLLAGYRGVIATMWTIMDNDAPQVASDVYSHLFETSPPDPAGAAEALHLAIRKLRKGSGGKKSFFHWVPFIHVGV